MTFEERSMMETFVITFHTRFDKLEHTQNTYERLHNGVHQEIKEDLNEIKKSIRDQANLSTTRYDAQNKDLACRVDVCSQRFLPRWLLPIVIAALVFIGGLTFSNLWRINACASNWEHVTKPQIIAPDS